MSEERLDHRFSHEWHVAINQFHDGKIGSPDWRRWMYEAKTMADEVPRLTMLFKRERDGLLKSVHTQCSRSESVPVVDNHLSCCLGVPCRVCPELLALDKIKGVTPEQIDQAKAWTCATHIVSNGGDHAGEGYLLTVDDRMYWDRVYHTWRQVIQTRPPMTDAGWTADKPTVPGWYWWQRPDREISMALVFGPRQGLLVYLPDEEVSDDAISVSSTYGDTKWLGPITPTDRETCRAAGRMAGLREAAKIVSKRQGWHGELIAKQIAQAAQEVTSDDR